MEAAGFCQERSLMIEQTPVQELKSERVQEESLALMRKRVARPEEDAVGAAMAVTRNRAEQRLKSERVQSRLKRMPGWTLVGDGLAIDRVRQFADPLVAASYLTFASLVSRQMGQPLKISLTGSTVIIVLTGRSKGAAKGLSDQVLDLAEQLG